jgi:cupin 2 domain-containing protein
MSMTANFYEYARPAVGNETVDLLLARGGARIERIVSNRAGTGWYDQDEDEWVLLLEGTASLQIGSETVPLARGDSLLLKAGEKHRVVSTSEDALWLAVFIKVC